MFLLLQPVVPVALKMAQVRVAAKTAEVEVVQEA
jgi:hypothetical protein